MEGKRVIVMGLGLHGGGASVIRWLLKHGARVTVTDLKTKKQLVPSLRQFEISNLKSQIRFVFGRHRASDFRHADIVIQNPAVPRESPYLAVARVAGAQIENEATLFFKHCRSKNIIGVTGTRGKSTTCAMIAAILQESKKARKQKSNVWLAGNIRTTPMLSIVDRVRPDDWVVLELSSWHLENMGEQRMSPHIAVVTNLLQDHLNRYRSMRDYARAKENIVRYQKKGDIAVLNKQNVWTRTMGKRTNAKVVWFTVPPLKVRGGEGALCMEGILGDHNFANMHAAASVARTIGIPMATIRSALKNFRGLPDRQEVIRTVRGVTYVNDTTATTPDATIAALRRFGCQVSGVRCQRKIVLICGGTDKNLDYHSLIPWIKKTCKAVILLPGSATEKIKKQYPISNIQFPMIEVGSMVAAVSAAASLASRYDIVLLSPSAASFNMFQHEFDRGEQFKKAVKLL